MSDIVYLKNKSTELKRIARAEWVGRMYIINIWEVKYRDNHYSWLCKSLYYTLPLNNYDIIDKDEAFLEMV